MAVVLLLGLVGVGAAAAGTASAPSATVTPVLVHLDNPRGVAVDGAGALYVAEAGQWQGTFDENGNPQGQGVTHTGRVSKWVPSSAGGPPKRVWATPFTSLFDSAEGPEALGPAGLTLTGASCLTHGTGCQPLVIADESNAGIKAVTGLDVPQIGHLFRLDASGHPTDLSDVGDQMYAWTDQNKSLFPDDFPDSNPFGVVVNAHGRVFVIDAGANTVTEVLRDGSTRVIAYIPNETGPPFRDSTPTCAAEGPDGALYVGTLDLVSNLFVNGPGQSHVYRVDPNTHEDPVAAGSHLWASGLTTVTSCTFDAHGTFWATEMFQPTGGPPGDLARIRWPGSGTPTVEHVGGGSLPLPGGVAPARDGSLFVTVGSADPTIGAGGVVRVTVSG